MASKIAQMDWQPVEAYDGDRLSNDDLLLARYNRTWDMWTFDVGTIRQARARGHTHYSAFSEPESSKPTKANKARRREKLARSL